MADLIYLGNLAEIDTDESNLTNEVPSVVFQTFRQGDMQNVSVTMTDNFDPGITYDDDEFLPADDFIYSLGAGTITSGLDSEGRYSAIIKDADGDLFPVTISVYQLQNGDTFARLPDGFQIHALTITGLVQDGFDSITTGVTSTSTVVCFKAGTWIDTSEGPCRVERLQPGQAVLTLDAGPQTLLWVHRAPAGPSPVAAPVRIAAGALGPDRPRRPLLVSPQHRILVRSSIAQELTGSREVLIAAHHLCALRNIRQIRRLCTKDYVHVFFARHCLVRANGAYAESLLLGDQAQQGLKRAGQALTRLLDQPMAPARPVPDGPTARAIIARHKKQGIALVAGPPAFRRKTVGGIEPVVTTGF